MSFAELRDALAAFSERTDIVGFDLTEVNPQLDIGAGITFYSTAHTVVEFLWPICPQPRRAARREGGLHAQGMPASIHEKTWEPAGP